MRGWQSQSHVRWYGKYHVVFVPKYRKRPIYGPLRKGIGKIIRDLCSQQGVELVEGHAMPDHVHLCLSAPPKFSAANTVGFVKGKSAIRIHREYLGKQRNLTGYHFWVRGYCVSTVGLDEDRPGGVLDNRDDAHAVPVQVGGAPFHGRSSCFRESPPWFASSLAIECISIVNDIQASVAAKLKAIRPELRAIPACRDEHATPRNWRGMWPAVLTPDIPSPYT